MFKETESKGRAALLAGIDTGGTFTDVVLLSGGKLRYCKVLSTPDDPSRAIFEGLDRLGVADRELMVIHGTTVGTNAVLEGKGARVAYVTSKGFADVLSLGRQNREQVYSLRQPEVRPPVSPELCFEVSSRVDSNGNILDSASDAEIESLRDALEKKQVEAVAINLLFSFLSPKEEQKIADGLGERHFISLSSQVLPELREFERGIATWLDASVGPVISKYLARLEKRIPSARISVMQSSGTTIAAEQAASQAVRLLLSGPAGGLSAALLAGRVAGHQQLLTFDMGGTSTDVSLLDGEIPVSSENRIGNWPLTISSVDIHTIGAGGGSIARVDRGGMLLVGPESAGANPGPACYGQGGESVTVTDANIVLGRIPGDTLLGAYLPLDVEAAGRAMDQLGRQLGCSRLAAANGVVRLANEHMARALRTMSIERGHDPRDYTLLSFGGAGGLHACELADLLEISRVLLPARAGVLSAQGMLSSEPGRSLSQAVLENIESLGDEDLESMFSRLESDATIQLAQEGVGAEEIKFQRRLELRYQGQSSTLLLDFVPGQNFAGNFHQAHEAFSGHRLELGVELVNLRLGARGRPAMSSLEAIESRAGDQGKKLFMPEMKGVVDVFDRMKLGKTQSVNGPAIITESGSTAWIAPGWKATLDDWGNLLLSRS